MMHLRGFGSFVALIVLGVRVSAAPPTDTHPDWRPCTILYGVVPALFGTDGLSDVTKHIDELSNLGVTALWLPPVTQAPRGDFGYALTDPFHLRRDLGAPSDLRRLIDSAHAHGIRVLLDFVTNHLSSQAPYFKDAETLGRRSRYFDWFQRDGNGQPVHYFDWSSLENLNYGNPAVRNFELTAITHWFREFPIDGFRADAAWAVRNRDPSFWPVMRTRVEHLRPQALLIAEASARDPYYLSHGFDVAYDWTSELGHWAWQGVFGPPGHLPDLRLLRAALTNNGHGFPDSVGVLHFINNNDTGERFITLHGIADARLAAALLLTVPGVPLIYAGDEVGAAFEPYAHPRPVEWKDPDHLLPLYTRLTHLRLELPALRSPALRLVHTANDDSLLAYIRPGREPAQDVTVILNFGPSSLDFPLAAAGGANAWAEDLLTGERTVVPPEAKSIPIAPEGAVLLDRGNPARLSSSCPRFTE